MFTIFGLQRIRNGNSQSTTYRILWSPRETRKVGKQASMVEDGVGDWRETRENRVWATAAEGRERNGGTGFGNKARDVMGS